MKRQRVGVVGLGPIGNLHADVYRETEGAELVCVCDIDSERADAAAERLGVPAFYSVPEMLSRADLTMASVATGGEEYGSRRDLEAELLGNFATHVYPHRVAGCAAEAGDFYVHLPLSNVVLERDGHVNVAKSRRRNKADVVSSPEPVRLERRTRRDFTHHLRHSLVRIDFAPPPSSIPGQFSIG